MITAIAIDDEPQALAVIKIHSARIADLHLVAEFSDPTAAMAFLKQHPVDLIFLDINMPNISGLALLDSLQRKPHVVFTTAYADFALTVIPTTRLITY